MIIKQKPIFTTRDKNIKTIHTTRDDNNRKTIFTTGDNNMKPIFKHVIKYKNHFYNT